MQKNTDQKNSEYGLFSRSDCDWITVIFMLKYHFRKIADIFLSFGWVTVKSWPLYSKWWKLLRQRGIKTSDLIAEPILADLIQN